MKLICKFIEGREEIYYGKEKITFPGRAYRMISHLGIRMTKERVRKAIQEGRIYYQGKKIGRRWEGKPRELRNFGKKSFDFLCEWSEAENPYKRCPTCGRIIKKINKVQTTTRGMGE